MRQRAPLGVRDHELQRRDRQALADARPLVDLAVGARLERDLFDDFPDVGRNLNRRPPVRSVHASCIVMAMRVLPRGRVVRADLRSDAVLAAA